MREAFLLTKQNCPGNHCVSPTTQALVEVRISLSTSSFTSSSSSSTSMWYLKMLELYLSFLGWVRNKWWKLHRVHGSGEYIKTHLILNMGFTCGLESFEYQQAANSTCLIPSQTADISRQVSWSTLRCPSSRRIWWLPRCTAWAESRTNHLCTQGVRRDTVTLAMVFFFLR